jgi:hypothetical protein
MSEHVCGWCGRIYRARLDRAARRVYCSRACMGMALRTRPSVEFGGRLFRPGTNGYWQALDGTYLHRAVWEAGHGPLAAGADVHHRDGDRSNNAPDNLFALEHGEHSRLHNVLERRRVVRGSEVGTARLDEAGVREIKRGLAAGETRGGLARRFGVSLRTVQFIANGSTWRHVE